jgi:hypothetical protein
VTLEVRFSSEAVVELGAAATWYEEQRPGLGDLFLGAVDEALVLLAEWPHIGAPVAGLRSDPEVRSVPVRRFPYHLPYLMLDHIRVLAVAHDRRRPNYWAARSVR